MAPRIAAAAALVLAASALPAGAEMLYFKNKRAIQVDSWQIKGRLIYLTMAGKTVYMKADSVDWETTEKLKQGGVALEKVDYAVVDAAGETDEAAQTPGGEGTVLTAADLRRVGSGYKLRRAAAPSLTADVPAEAGWVDSGVNVRAGQSLTLKSSGRVVLAQGKETGPEGLPTPGGAVDAVLSDRPHGALLARVGLGGEIRVLGRSSTYVAPATGRLYFAVNDKTPLDNSGAFTVRIELPTATTASGSSAAALLGDSPVAVPTAGAHPISSGQQGGVGRAKNARDALQGSAAASQGASGKVE